MPWLTRRRAAMRPSRACELFPSYLVLVHLDLWTRVIHIFVVGHTKCIDYSHGDGPKIRLHLDLDTSVMAFSEFDIHTHMFTFSSQDFLLRFGMSAHFSSHYPSPPHIGVLVRKGCYTQNPPNRFSKKTNCLTQHPGTTREVVHLIPPTYRRQAYLGLLSTRGRG